MGLSFKSIGKKLKGVTKAISLKNGIKLATGDYRSVAKEVGGRLIKVVAPSGTKQPDKDNAQITKNQQALEDYLVMQAEQNVKPLTDKVENQIANSKVGQDISTFLTKQYLLTMWTKYRTYIILGVLAILAFVFRKKIFGTKSRR